MNIKYWLVLLGLLALWSCEKENISEKNKTVEVLFEASAFSEPDEQPMARAVGIGDAMQVTHLRYFLFERGDTETKFIKQWYYTRIADNIPSNDPVYKGLIGDGIKDILPVGNYTAVFVGNVTDDKLFSVSDTVNRSYLLTALNDTIQGTGGELFGGSVDFSVVETSDGMVVNILLQHWGSLFVLGMNSLNLDIQSVRIRFEQLVSRIYFDGSLAGRGNFVHDQMKPVNKSVSVYISPSVPGQNLSLFVRLYTTSGIKSSTFSTREISQGRRKNLNL